VKKKPPYLALRVCPSSLGHFSFVKKTVLCLKTMHARRTQNIGIKIYVFVNESRWTDYFGEVLKHLHFVAKLSANNLPSKLFILVRAEFCSPDRLGHIYYAKRLLCTLKLYTLLLGPPD
jgi:hypothetical protein